jgi:hypothetical protein
LSTQTLTSLTGRGTPRWEYLSRHAGKAVSWACAPTTARRLRMTGPGLWCLGHCE